MSRLLGALLVSAGSLLLLGSEFPAADTGRASPAPVPARLIPAVAAAPPAPLAPPAPSPPTAREALADGVLMVVSIPSQRIFVLKDGQPWDSAPVSTGRPGHATPTGEFPILQKRVHHRSNLYDNAPMPYMQRLTWGGVALHAGHVPGYPASHGCIRLPWSFAQKLYAITDFESSVALVTDQPVGSAEEARLIAGGGSLPRLAQPAPQPDPRTAGNGPAQTIQLAATASPDSAAALWQELRQRRPELAALEHAVIPAVVRSRQVYRLRASGAGAHALCGRLATAGIACLKV